MDLELLREPLLLCDQTMSEPRVLGLGGGVVAAYSARCPTKATANEDAAALIPLNDHGAVLAVADGVGGGAAGEFASRTALESLRRAVKHALAQGLQTRTAILNGLEEANASILASGAGAATTLAVVELTRDTMRPYHVGDSLILLLGGRGKRKLQTIPHSPVGYGVEAGLLNEAEAMHHDQRHIVSNVVGCPGMRIEIGPTLTLAPRDTLLLASDGLTDNLRLEEIAERLRGRSLAESAARLAHDAGRRMSHPTNGHPSKADDLTFIAFRPTAPRGLTLAAS